MFLPGAWRMTDLLRREASAALVDAALAAAAARYVQESSALVYPDRGDSWIDESTPFSRYAIAGQSPMPSGLRSALPVVVEQGSCYVSPDSTAPTLHRRAN